MKRIFHQSDTTQGFFPAKMLSFFAFCIFLFALVQGTTVRGQTTYRFFQVEEKDRKVLKTTPIPEKNIPAWAKDVSQQKSGWKAAKAIKKQPYFSPPVPFVIPPAEGSGEPFYAHNHQPSITWLENGDLLAIWFSTMKEAGTEMTVLASRLRAGKNEWEPASEFFKAKDRNMTGSSLFNDGKGTLYHFNSMGAEGETGWANLAILLRTSRDNGKTWTNARPVAPDIKGRHQVISGTIKTAQGYLIQACDAHWSSSGGTALHISKDGGSTWTDPGEGIATPKFSEVKSGQGTIAGIHGGVVELKDGRLLAFGRSDNIDGKMPMSISEDLGKTWTYSASPFPPIHSGQRLVLMRLKEGPLLFMSFTHYPDKEGGMAFKDADGNTFQGKGMYAALSYDEGKTWPVQKLLTPGTGEFDGGGWTRTFAAAKETAEPRGYLAVTQTPDGIIHLISSRLHYKFNLMWLETPPR